MILAPRVLFVVEKQRCIGAAHQCKSYHHPDFSRRAWISLLEMNVVCVATAALHIPDGLNGVGVLWVQVIHVVVVR